MARAYISLLIPLYVGVIEPRFLESLRKDLRPLTVEILSADADQLYATSDRDVRDQYLEGCTASLHGTGLLESPVSDLLPDFHFEIDIFEDGICILMIRLTLAHDAEPDRVYEILVGEIRGIDHRDSALFVQVDHIVAQLSRLAKPDPDLARVQREMPYWKGVRFAYPLVAFRDIDLEEERPELVQSFMCPDWGGLSRPPRHLKLRDYVGEWYGQTKVHASWETFLVHGRPTAEDLSTYDLLNRILLRTWVLSSLLDRSASLYLGDLAQFLESRGGPPGRRGSRELVTRIRGLRRQYLAVRDYMDEIDANMSMRFVDLLKYAWRYSNLHLVLESLDRKLHVLAQDYAAIHQESEAEREEMLNWRVGVISLVLAVVGTVQVTDILVRDVLKEQACDGWCRLAISLGTLFVIGVVILVIVRRRR